MKKLSLIGFAIAALLAVPALAQESAAPQAKPLVYHHRSHHGHPAHAAPLAGYEAQVAPPAAPGLPSFFPHIGPYPNGKGDEDGLSRSVGDCNKGCIGEP